MNYIKYKRRTSKFFEHSRKVFRKNHLDFITALLSIPVLLSVIILNYSNLHPKTANVTPTPSEKIIVVPQNNTGSPAPTSSTCVKGVGPVEISYPKENQVVDDNPVCISIKYDDSKYCSVVWSYRVNNGSWSDYNSNNPCIYNLPSGNTRIDLRVQSTVNQSTQTLTRNFVYQNPSATPSATQ